MADATEPITPLTFDLMFRRQCEKRVKEEEGNGYKWVMDLDREQSIPEHPDPFIPLRGDHPTVAKQADFLNTVQRNSGFSDYFYFPEVAPMEGAR